MHREGIQSTTFQSVCHAALWMRAACEWHRKTRQIWRGDTLKVIETLWAHAEGRDGEGEWGCATLQSGFSSALSQYVYIFILKPKINSGYFPAKAQHKRGHRLWEKTSLSHTCKSTTLRLCETLIQKTNVKISLFLKGVFDVTSIQIRNTILIRRNAPSLLGLDVEGEKKT